MNFFRYLIMIFFISILGGSTNHFNTRYIHADCSIFDFSGKLYKKYPGSMCIFFKDGSYIQNIYPQNLRYISAGHTLITSKNIMAHHELEASHDQKRIALVADHFMEKDGKKRRYDILKILNRDLNDLYTWSTLTHWEELNKILQDAGKPPLVLNEYIHQKIGKTYEYTHINSLKEIPANDLYPQLSYLKPGNYIATMNCMGLFMFFDPTLSRIEKVIHYQNHIACNAHDAHVLKSGHILYFRNYAKSPEDGPALVEINPMTLEETWNWKINSIDSAESMSQGSVQFLSNGNFLYVDRGHADNMGAVEISRHGIIANALDQEMLKAVLKHKPYRARIEDLGQFLENTW